jgi:hypothetical protein
MHAFLVPVLFAAACLAGCTAKQSFEAGQASRRHDCGRITDAEEYRRCMQRASASWEEYRLEEESRKSR